jgi:hypothetical protein
MQIHHHIILLYLHVYKIIVKINKINNQYNLKTNQIIVIITNIEIKNYINKISINIYIIILILVMEFMYHSLLQNNHNNNNHNKNYIPLLQ